MSFTVAVAGASGYAGGEVLRLLAAHPLARVGAVTGNSSAGQALGRHHPHLVCLADRVIEPTAPAALAGHDVIVLALPHGKSGAVAAQLEAAGTEAVLVDLGADHRLISPKDWADYYGGDHPGTWTYGMPELLTGWPPVKQRAALAGAKRIAVPGCNVTAVTLALAPGVAAGWLSPQDLVAVLANGVSGAGKALKAHLAAAEILGSASPYAVGGSHRHIPEIVQNLAPLASANAGASAGADAGASAEAGQGGAAAAAMPTISFTPTLVPMSRGILATVSAKPGPRFDPEAARQPWERAYGDERFVRLLPAGVWPSTAHTLGANSALIQVAFDRRAGRVVVIAAIDNLVKGTAGAAVQSINLALGLPEETGLELNGVAP
ncbi:MAG: N-acetyl-gamma-glutamyl-phosphate reductase [Bifidobacteriaceae bacterium]|jgi:N-acetyl-gamma-glutamyl-phosphate reductase|nr:N-acetyl-gamma-glutamyl-phosphate reductase [Bifidobacteriaceae bacterium]